MTKVKITLRSNHGGELDCRFVEVPEGIDPFEDHVVNGALIALAEKCTFAHGDTIIIEEID